MLLFLVPNRPKIESLVQLLTELLKFLYFLQSRKYINRDTIPLYCGIVFKMLMCNNLEESFILNYEITRRVLNVDNEKKNRNTPLWGCLVVDKW